MFNHISDIITEKLIENNTVQAENKEIYRFGIQQFFTMLLNIITVIIIGISLQMLGRAVLFIAVFIPLRIYAGGVHAKTPIRCYLYSVIFIVSVFLVMKHANLHMFICCILYASSGIVVLFLSPVEDKNKILDKLEISVYKKRTRIIWMTESIVALICILLNLKTVFECFTFSSTSLSIILILGVLNNKFNKVN